LAELSNRCTIGGLLLQGIMSVTFMPLVSGVEVDQVM